MIQRLTSPVKPKQRKSVVSKDGVDIEQKAQSTSYSKDIAKSAKIADPKRSNSIDLVSLQNTSS